MATSVRLLTFCSKASKFHPTLFRNHSTIVKKELEVPTFCDIFIDIPYHVRLKPLNIHKYHNCDKLIIQMDEKYENYLDHDIDGNQIKIFSNGDKHDSDDALCVPSDIFCSVKAPVKANLIVKSKKDIIIGSFNGDKLHLKSSEGNIFIDKFQGNSVKLKTRNGNIVLKEFIQASNITAEVSEHGSIISSRLQGLSLKLKTKKGNISIESSYSNESDFQIDYGNFDLHNIHKSCRLLLKEGNLNLTGFDGNLKAVVEKGSANIHLSRITDNSEINVLNGTLNLKLGDACQDYVQFKIHAKGCDIADNVKSTADKIDEASVILIPDVNNENTVQVNCLNGTVSIESASWQDIIKARFKK